MPEVIFRIRWPDGQEETCYSPSTVLRDFLTPDQSYRVDEFSDRVTAALDAAANRVKALRGMRCSLADAEARRLSQILKRYRPEETVQCLSMN